MIFDVTAAAATAAAAGSDEALLGVEY